MAHQESLDPKPIAPIEYRGAVRHACKTKLDGEVFSEYMKETAQIADKITRHPLDDARRSGPRARHAQHVHRLPPEPGAATTRASAASSRHELGVAQQPAAVRLHPVDAQPVRRQRLSVDARTARSAWARPGQRRNFTVRDLNLPGGSTTSASTAARTCWRRSTTTSASMEKSRRARRDGFVLPAGLRADQLEGGPRGVQHDGRAGRDSRTQYGRNAAGRRMLMARRLVEVGRAVRLDDLRRLGPSREHQQRHSSSRCRSSTRRSPR